MYIRSNVTNPEPAAQWDSLIRMTTVTEPNGAVTTVNGRWTRTFYDGLGGAGGDGLGWNGGLDC